MPLRAVTGELMRLKPHDEQYGRDEVARLDA